MSRWLVYSPEMETAGDSLDPPEPFADCVDVEAPNKRAAILRGVKLMQNWPQEQRADGHNPFRGVKAERY